MLVRAFGASVFFVVCSVGCSDATTGGGTPTTSGTTAPATDPELEQLKQTTPVDACGLLGEAKLRAIFPDQTFTVHDKVAPQLSGYVWDSRCTQWAGVGSQAASPDTPSHSVDVYVATAATEDKAKRNLASRHETAPSTTGYRAQTALGPNAYSVAGTGFARVFFVKGQSEIQVNVSYLTTNVDERVAKAVALAQAL